MDNDLISRSELKEHFSNYDLTRGIINIQEVMYYIDNAPTVELFCAYLSDGEVRQPCIESPCKHERPQGEWIRVDKDKMKCSRCEVIHLIAQYPNSANINYCPNCGAKMKQV